MHGEDLVNGPIGHGTGGEHGTGRDYMIRFLCALDRCSQFSDSDSSRRLDTALD
jgi:hypothetical protein